MAAFDENTELELELIQSHIAQKPVLRSELGCACVAREVSVERGGMGERVEPFNLGSKSCAKVLPRYLTKNVHLPAGLQGSWGVRDAQGHSRGGD